MFILSIAKTKAEPLICCHPLRKPTNLLVAKSLHQITSTIEKNDNIISEYFGYEFAFSIKRNLAPLYERSQIVWLTTADISCDTASDQRTRFTAKIMQEWILDYRIHWSYHIPQNCIISKLLIPYKTLEWLLKDAIKAQLVMIPCGVGAHLSGWYIYLKPITTIQCYAPDYRNTWAQEPSGKIGTDASHHHVQCPLGEFVLPPLKHSV